MDPDHLLTAPNVNPLIPALDPAYFFVSGSGDHLQGSGQGIGLSVAKTFLASRKPIAAELLHGAGSAMAVGGAPFLAHLGLVCFKRHSVQ